MDAGLGDVKHLGFVTRDIDRSMRYFVDAWGIGPWYVNRQIVMDTLYKGAPSRLELMVALSHANDLQYELIQQMNDAPSVYRDFLHKMPNGLHVQHLSVWPENFADTKAGALAKGWYPVLEVAHKGNSCYLAHPGEPDLCVEISDRSPEKEFFRKTIREICATWDGKDPIREGFPTGNA
jgi:hypothetical protein